jgi:hypothetical protein
MKSFEYVVVFNLAVLWKTPQGEKIYKTPSGWPLTKKAREQADEFDKILNRKIRRLMKQLRKEGYFKMKPGLPKYHRLGRYLQFVKDLKLRSKCDPDLENIWRAFYDYAPRLAQRKLPKSEERTVGKRNFFLMCYRLGLLSEKAVERMGNWSNWEDIYMVFAGNPQLWKDWERLLSWILRNSENNGKIEREKLRRTLRFFRKLMGKRSKIKRDTTVLTDDELSALLDSATKMSSPI